MRETYIEDFRDHVGQEVIVRGWLHNIRSKGKIHFLILRDGTGFVQAVMAIGDAESPAAFEAAGKVPHEASVRARGIVRADARAPGGFELSLRAVDVVALPAAEYPIANQAHGVGFLMEQRHLWLRSRMQHAILRVRSRVIKAIRDFLDARGYICVDAPIFTPAACEGTTTLFEVKYFDDDKAYLSQSGQLYMEAAAMAHGRVYCLGPVFRAEKSKTRKHLTEFWMLEPEIAFGTLEDVMDLGEDLIVHVVGEVLSRCGPELAALGRDPARLAAVQRPFPRITYDEAAERIRAAGLPFTWGADFGAPDEDAVSKGLDRPLLVHRWPREVKAFYMRPDPADPRYALGVDFIAPDGYGEIIGGGERAESLEYLESQIAAHGLPKDAFEWYLDLRRYGTVRHGGFGLGIERFVAWITGAEHVRECIPFPRMLYRIYP